MLKNTWCLVAILASAKAIAAESASKEAVLTDDLVAQAKKACMAQEYEGSDEIKLISRLQCLNGIEMKQLRQRQAAGDKKLDQAIAKMEAQAAMFETMLKAQAEAAKAAADKAKRQQLRPGMLVGGPMMAPAPYVLLDKPGSYLAATWEMPEMAGSLIRIVNIGETLGYKLGIQGVPVRIVIKKNGTTLAIAHPGTTNGMPSFNAFYADLDGDGKPDTLTNQFGQPVVYKGADALNDQLYVSYRPGDYVEVFFLIDSGRMLSAMVPGMQSAVMWKTYAAWRLQPQDPTPKRWDMTPYLGARIR